MPIFFRRARQSMCREERLERAASILAEGVLRLLTKKGKLAAPDDGETFEMLKGNRSPDYPLTGW